MKLTLSLTTILLAGAPASQAAAVLLDNYIGQQNGDTAGAVGNFRVQSATLNVAGLGASDTVAANSPFPTTTVYLQSFNALRAVTGNSNQAGNLYINVFQGAGSGGTFLGSSTNTVNVEGAAALSSLTWNFANIAVNSASQLAFVFSTTATNDTFVLARLQVARDTGGNFNSTHSGGTADDAALNNSPSNFDSRFSIGFDTVPEPSSAMIGGIGILLLLRRSR